MSDLLDAIRAAATIACLVVMALVIMKGC